MTQVQMSVKQKWAVAALCLIMGHTVSAEPASSGPNLGAILLAESGAAATAPNAGVMSKQQGSAQKSNLADKKTGSKRPGSGVSKDLQEKFRQFEFRMYEALEFCQNPGATLPKLRMMAIRMQLQDDIGSRAEKIEKLGASCVNAAVNGEGNLDFEGTRLAIPQRIQRSDLGDAEKLLCNQNWLDIGALLDFSQKKYIPAQDEFAVKCQGEEPVQRAVPPISPASPSNLDGPIGK